MPTPNDTISVQPADHFLTRTAVRHMDWVAALAVGVLGLVTLPTTLTEGDGAEWLVIGRYGGVPHPSGYPLYALICRLAALASPPLPLVTCIAFASVVCAAAAAAVTYRALDDLGYGPVPSLGAVLAVFSAAVVWRVDTMVEPFALNILLAAVIFAASARAFAARQRGAEALGTAVVLGVAFGLGVCNHHSLVWMVPLGLAGLWLASRRRLAVALRFAVGFVAGLLPLGYLAVLRTDVSPFNYYRLDRWRDFVHLLLRSQYGTFNLGGDAGRNFASLLHFGVTLPAWLSWGFFALALLGVAAWVRQVHAPTVRARRGVLLGWAASFLLASVLFLSLFDVEVHSWIVSIIERFMALPTWLLVLPIAEGLTVLMLAVDARRPGSFAKLLVVAVAAHIVIQSHHADRTTDTFYQDHVHALFRAARVGGDVLVTASDEEGLATLDGRYILDLGGAHFVWLNAPFWKERSYRPKAVRALGLDPSATHLSLTGVVTRLVAQRGFVTVTDLPEPPLPSLFHHAYPLGPFTILVRPDIPLPSPSQLWDENRAFYATLRPRTCSERRNLSGWNRALWWKYIDGAHAVQNALEVAGAPGLAHAAAGLAEKLARCVTTGR